MSKIQFSWGVFVALSAFFSVPAMALTAGSTLPVGMVFTAELPSSGANVSAGSNLPASLTLTSDAAPISIRGNYSGTRVAFHATASLPSLQGDESQAVEISGSVYYPFEPSVGANAPAMIEIDSITVGGLVKTDALFLTGGLEIGGGLSSQTGSPLYTQK